MKQPWTVVLFEAGWVGLMVGVGAFCIFVWPLETNGDVDSPAGRTTLEAPRLRCSRFRGHRCRPKRQKSDAPSMTGCHVLRQKS